MVITVSVVVLSLYLIMQVIRSTFLEEFVSLELIWTNGNVTYPLNENSTDDIMC